MNECNHKWLKYQLMPSRKLIKKCSLCHKKEPFTLKPRFKFQNEIVGFAKLDFWTPPKEKIKLLPKKKEKIPTPLHYIAWKRHKYEKTRVLNHWVIDHIKKIRKEDIKRNYVYKPRPKTIKKPFLVKDYDAILDDYIKIVRIPLKK